MAAVLLIGGLRAAAAADVECWRGWGYRVDGQTGAYKSGELLLVTKGDVAWESGRPVNLYVLNRQSGRIASNEPLTVIPISPRVYYRGRLNYVDARAEVSDADDGIVFGLSHIPAPSAPIQELRAYNAWACGLAPGAN